MLKNNKFLILRGGLFVFFILTAAICQNFRHGPRVNAFWLIVLPICVSVFEKPYSAMFFGALSGALWDFFSGAADGFNAFFLCAACLLTSLAALNIIRKNLLSAVILVFAASMLYVGIYMAFFASRGISGGLYGLFKGFYLPDALFSTAASVPVFYIIKFSHSVIRPKKEIYQ
ncbi:MAG: rod shape-determining protein MreD [Oscillospiraceae bacterium]|nr:rod shape-determining protein MreD [Oscillospiraceae bacterium]